VATTPSSTRNRAALILWLKVDPAPMRNIGNVSDARLHTFGRTAMISHGDSAMTRSNGKAPSRHVYTARPAAGLAIGTLGKRFGSIACAACIATMAVTAAASAQQQSPRPPGQYTAMVVMTPNGPATCTTWIQWRLPGAHPADKAAIEYWSEGYLSGLAAGSHHDVIGQFRRDELVAWLDRYCTANPQTPLPHAINALGHAMLAHPGGPL
jgi:hypothetical protein